MAADPSGPFRDPTAPSRPSETARVEDMPSQAFARRARVTLLLPETRRPPERRARITQRLFPEIEPGLLGLPSRPLPAAATMSQAGRRSGPTYRTLGAVPYPSGTGKRSSWEMPPRARLRSANTTCVIAGSRPRVRVPSKPPSRLLWGAGWLSEKVRFMMGLVTIAIAIALVSVSMENILHGWTLLGAMIAAILGAAAAVLGLVLASLWGALISAMMLLIAVAGFLVVRVLLPTAHEIVLNAVSDAVYIFVLGWLKYRSKRPPSSRPPKEWDGGW